MSTGVEPDHSAVAMSRKLDAPPAAMALGVAPIVAAPVTEVQSDRRVPLFLWLVSAGFAALWSWASYCRWANFGYRTFDLAYYVQALWQLIHGRFTVTVENVPLLGNHVEPIVFLFAPLFAVVRHPMVFVTVQNAALASMAPLGYLLARRLFDGRISALLSLALLLTPATSFVALHEFHPEALSAPLLLLLVYARATGKLWLHWTSFFAVLACKENMALLLAAYCIVFLLIERRRGFDEQLRWYIVPLLVAAGWFLTGTQIISPALNAGNIEYARLYDRLGKSAGEIISNVMTKPQLMGHALFDSLRQGNLVAGLVLPFLLLPVLRPRWLLISAPIFLQHLLSWRSSEWSIYFHYAAPLLPLMWIGAVEGMATVRDRWYPIEGRDPSSPPSNQRSGVTTLLASTLLLACLAGQSWFGSSAAIWSDLRGYSKSSAERARKEAFMAKIPADASVVAPLPYLSHLAMREKLYSLHYILKGLKTLSHQRYEPPPAPDFVLIDYEDKATFDPSAGYYHPQMRTTDGQIVPSSDQLLNWFLAGEHWSIRSDNELTLLQRKPGLSETAITGAPNDLVFQLQGVILINFMPRGNSVLGNKGLDYQFAWSFTDDNRQIFPWMILRLTNDAGGTWTITKGLCAPEIIAGDAEEVWHLSRQTNLPPGDYNAEALFFDNARRAISATKGGAQSNALITAPVQLGRMTVTP